jgi:hypothetical protein
MQETKRDLAAAVQTNPRKTCSTAEEGRAFGGFQRSSAQQVRQLKVSACEQACHHAKDNSWTSEAALVRCEAVWSGPALSLAGAHGVRRGGVA